MNQYKQKLIDYMTFKKNLLHESYFTEEDQKAIEDWSDEDAEKVFYQIFDELELDDGDVFGCIYCPFCVMIDLHDLDCNSCTYGKTHGTCDNDNSDWQNYIKPLRVDYYRNEIKEWLINNFYVD